MIAHWYPGLGDPLDLPCDRFDSLIEQIGVIERRKRGENSAADARDRWLKSQRR